MLYVQNSIKIHAILHFPAVIKSQGIKILRYAIDPSFGLGVLFNLFIFKNSFNRMKLMEEF